MVDCGLFDCACCVCVCVRVFVIAGVCCVRLSPFVVMVVRLCVPCCVFVCVCPDVVSRARPWLLVVGWVWSWCVGPFVAACVGCVWLRSRLCVCVHVCIVVRYLVLGCASVVVFDDGVWCARVVGGVRMCVLACVCLSVLPYAHMSMIDVGLRVVVCCWCMVACVLLVVCGCVCVCVCCWVCVCV